ncbi:MAG: nucleotidyl transferase AbiEii/AbiGii toxin family protein [Clostridia bacterium]|nr:nucleotidyl transferase AbiEii/AbiGii toxin family protein [Clostridia bacterium]
MRTVATINENDRKALIHNTAAKMGMTDAIIEKDFWVCYMLDYLFHRCAWKNHIAFKGGTSLSKAYGLIERFSEDIDLILDWRVLGYGINEPWNERSNTKQDAFNKEANARAEIFLRDTFLPAVSADLTIELGEKIKCVIEENDLQTVKIFYPNSFSDSSILQEIRLEIGVLAAWTPAAVKPITPYAALRYARLFKEPTTEILTVLPERTFWARYDEATTGTMKLIPAEKNIKALREDYEHMKNMIFGEKPEFDVILNAVKTLEDEINAL